MNTLQMRMDIHREEPISIAAALSAMLLFAGMGRSIVDMLALPVSWPALAVGCLAILLALLMRRLRWCEILLGALAAGMIVYGLVFADLKGELYGVINAASSAIGGHVGRNLARYSASEPGIFCACCLSVWLALGCVWLVKNRCAFVAALVCALLAVLDVTLGIRASDGSLCIAAAGILLSGVSERRSRGSVIAWMCLAGVMTICVTGSLLLLEGTLIPHVDELRQQLTAMIRTARFGGADSMPFGDFTDLAALEQTDATLLEVEMDSPESLYLRGFVGSDYTGEGWSEIEKTALADGADLFYWLHQDGFYGQTQLANAALLLEGDRDPEEAISITIRHVGASREYVYAPYELLSTSDDLIDAAGIGDVQPYSLKLRGTDRYQLVSLDNQVKRYTTLLSRLREAETAPDASLEGYLIDESHYNSFVYAHFLEVPEDASALFGELFGAETSTGERLGYGSAKQKVLSWLEENIEYSESIAPHVQGSDFLTEFLMQTKTGYDVHYATAAVLMMRYFGIPARYVEGYLITPETAQNAEANAVIALDGKSGHAWCEIYQDGLGWIPFEVAPKYLNLMEQPDILVASDQADAQAEPEPSPQEENSLDMEEDVYDDFDEEDEEQETALPSDWSRIAGLLLVLLLAALLGLLLRRRIALLQRRRSFRLRDRKQATTNLYAYLFSLMREIYRWYDCNAPSGFTANLCADLGKDASMKYQEVVRICEAAAFDTRGVAEDDYRFVYVFVHKTTKLLAKRASVQRRLYLQYISNLI